MPVVLDLRAFGDGEAHVGEDFGKLVHDLADRVDRPLRGFGRRERQVDRLGRQPAVELGGLECRLPRCDRVAHRLAQRVDLRPFRGARLRVHRAQRLELRRDAARLAERRHAQRLERGEIGRGTDLIEQVGHGAGPYPCCRVKCKAACYAVAMSEWPSLSPERDHETLAVLHLASQMLGKLRVAHSPWVNHGWNSTLRPRASGFAILPTAAGDGRSFTLALDLCRHGIALQVSDGAGELIPFAGNSVAQLHSRLVAALSEHRLPSSFHGRPNEVADAVPFKQDDAQRGYDPDSARRFHEALQLIVPILERFRAGFRGKASPVHLFWGGVRLRRHPLFRAAGAAAPGRHSGPARPDHPRGL